MAKPASARHGIVRSRLVFNFPGFEPTPPLAQLDRLRHSAEKTGEIWGFAYERLSADAHPEDYDAVADNVATAPNWQTHTRLVQFSWSDVIESYEREAFPRGFLRNFPKFMAFFADGTVGRYLHASKRYFGFTIFPLVLIAIFFIVSWLVIGWLAGMLDPQRPHPAWVILASLATTFLACRWPGQWAYLLLTVNDWGFARDMVNRVNPDIEQRYLTFADTLADEIARSRHDEIVIAGHSFGAVWAAGALAVALNRNPDLLKGRNVTFLALGSSLLKIALAPNAGFMRQWMARIAAVPNLVWHEIQTKDDWIAFYKADPFAEISALETGTGDIAATLVINRVKYREAMEARRYLDMLTSPYRTHRQYILYQDKRVHFDYVLRLFGPLSSRDLALDAHLIDAIGPDGRLDENIAGPVSPESETDQPGAEK